MSDRARQLMLAGCLLFGLAGLFLANQEPQFSNQKMVAESLPQRLGKEPGSLHRELHKELHKELQIAAAVVPAQPVPETAGQSLADSSGYSWVRLKFTANTSGEVEQITVIESCLKINPKDNCIDDDIHDDYAIRQIRMNRYDALSETEEIVFIPPEY